MRPEDEDEARAYWDSKCADSAMSDIAEIDLCRRALSEQIARNAKAASAFGKERIEGQPLCEAIQNLRTERDEARGELKGLLRLLSSSELACALDAWRGLADEQRENIYAIEVYNTDRDRPVAQLAVRLLKAAAR